MKNWVTGTPDVVAKVDPAIAAVLSTVVDIIVTLDLHTKMGLSAQQLLTVLLHIAAAATILRTWQLARQRRKARKNEPEPPPANDAEPPAEAA